MQRLLIVGAGVAGKTLGEDLKKNGYKVIGFLDDKVSSQPGKTKVLGKLSDVNKVVKKEAITDILISIPSAPSKLIRDFINSITSKKVKISIIPRSFGIIAKETVSMRDVRDVDILNLIGRQPVKQQFMKARKHFVDKTVVVTGAAGSIGSELVRQLKLLKTKRIICVDWWENGIFYLQQELQNSDSIEYRIANIQNRKRLEAIFKETKPEVVFHAAAYKHVPLMQENAVEAFNNNVFGSLNIMELCIEHRIGEFVYVSTDKAVNPVNVMGTTKRIGEMLMEILADGQKTTKLTAVRFGNVLASNGSVIPTFQKQIDSGGPLTVTHPDITRFFMTISEAAQLIIQSSTLGENGEIFVLDMGEPVKIIDLAKSMIRLSGKNIEIEFIGLRPGEKLHEELSFTPDDVKRTNDEKIYINAHEKPFEYKKFFSEIKSLIKETTISAISDDDLKKVMIKMGFRLKK